MKDPRREQAAWEGKYGRHWLSDQWWEYVSPAHNLSIQHPQLDGFQLTSSNIFPQDPVDGTGASSTSHLDAILVSGTRRNSAGGGSDDGSRLFSH